MPNFAFVSVTFAIHVALALWIGGTLFLGALAAPAIFRGASSRTAAGEIVGAMVGSFGRVKLVCLVVLILAAWLRFSLWEVWNGWIMARFALIASAVLFEVVATYGIGPRIRGAREAIAQAGLDFDGDPADPRRQRFRRLHGMTMGLQSLGAFCALGVLFTLF